MSAVLWDPENQGTPIYDSAHFHLVEMDILFLRFPHDGEFIRIIIGPADLRLHPRSFADAFGLREHITFNTEVRKAEPEGDRCGSSSPTAKCATIRA